MGQYPGYPPIRTLGDQLLLACASRKCLQSLDTPDAFLPIVVGALVLATAAHGDQIRGETMDAELLVEPALRWLAQVLPPKRDDESSQERMLEAVVLEIARRKAGGTSESTPTPQATPKAAAEDYFWVQRASESSASYRQARTSSFIAESSELNHEQSSSATDR